MEPFRYNAVIAAEIAGRVRAGEDLTEWFEMALVSVAADLARMMEMFEATSYHNLSPEEVHHGLLALVNFRDSILALREGAQTGSGDLIGRGVALAQQAVKTMGTAIQLNNKVAPDPVGDFLAG